MDGELEAVMAMARRQSGVVSRAQALSRISRGKFELRKERIEFAQVVKHALETIRPLCDSLHHEITVSFPPEPLHIDGDPIRLSQVVGNLLNNACKYTPAGGIITLSAQALTEQLELRVSNSGTEIAIAERDRIFDKFYRIPNNDPWKHGGTGLGLALVKKLTMHLGGTIHVESNDGQTTFILTLALACSEKPMKPYLVT